MKKKLLTLLLVLCTLLSVFPFGAGAADAVPQAEKKAEDFYVKEGLTLWLDALDKDSLAQTLDLTKGEWKSKVGSGVAALQSNGGAQWFTGEKGGVGFKMDWAQYSGGGKEAGLFPGIEDLPAQDFTVEMVLDPVGITNADGTRYAHPDYQYGVSQDWGIQLAGVWACTFPCLNSYPGSRDGGLELRWVSIAGGWAQFGGTYGYTPWIKDATSFNKAMGTVVSYTMVKDEDGADHATYSFYANAMKTGTIAVGEGETRNSKAVPYIKNDDSFSKFHLMKGFPSIFYQVRVYNRVLSTAEQQQNHFADLAVYFDLDLAPIQSADEATLLRLYASASSYSFANSKVDVQTLVDNAYLPPKETEKSVYDQLYVQDGLTLLLTVFDPEDESLDLQNSKWYSKVDGAPVLLLGDLWRVGENGGIRFDLGGHNSSTGINLSTDQIPTENYTLEMTAMGIGYTVNGDGVTAMTGTSQYGAQVTAFQVGPLKGEVFPTEREQDYSKYSYTAYVWDSVSGAYVPELKALTKEDYDNDVQYVKKATLNGDGTWSIEEASVRAAYYGNAGASHAYNRTTWYYSPATEGWQQTGASTGIWGLNGENNWRRSGEVAVVALKHEMTGAASANYTVLKNGGIATTFGVPKDKVQYIPVSSDQAFYLFRSFPAEVYSIRVYNRVLTDAELDYNHFVDLLAYNKLDPALLTGLSESQQALVLDIFASFAINTDGEVIESVVKAMTGDGNDFDAENSLYVTDGMTVLLSSMGEFKESVSIFGNNGLWFNQIDGTAKTLRGSKWQLGELGGVSHNMTFTEWNKDHDFGLFLDIGDLPDENYTVEMVLAPLGATNEDGTRYVDDKTTYGTYVDNGFAFGPFKAMSFICIRPAGKDGQLEHRWVYVKNGCWAAAGYKAWIQESVFSKTDGTKGINFTVMHTYKERNGEPFSTYKLYYEYDGIGTLERDGGAYYPVWETDGLFQIMAGIPGTLYAVRVYDRTLTMAELMQNHVADLVYYYDLDTELLNQALQYAEDPVQVYRLFKNMSFDLTKEEADAEFARSLAGLWVAADGLAIRLDNQVGLRGEFTITPDIISGMEALGFSFEIGAMVTIGGGTPTLEDNTAKIVAYQNGAKNEAFFIDEDTFVFTVNYVQPTREMHLVDVRFGFYVKAVKPDGSIILLSGDVDSAGYDGNSFSAYNNAVEGGYGNNFVKKMVNGCYESFDLYVDLEGSQEATGAEDDPFVNVADAIAKMMDILGEAWGPTDVKIYLGEGVYRINEAIEMNSEAFGTKYYKVSLLGSGVEDGCVTTLSGNVAIDSSLFQPVDGKNYYSYQFEADAEGAYPAFRYLYVDGKIATLAHQGATRYDSGEQNLTKVEMYYDPRMAEEEAAAEEANGTKNLSTAEKLALYKASQYYAPNKFYIDLNMVAGTTEEDWEQMELHIETQWDFNIIHVDHVDFEDTFQTKDGTTVVAVYFDEAERAAFNIPSNYTLINRGHWFENALSFVDEAGEYYYNEKTGTLYYYPEEGTEITDYSFEVPQVDNLLIFRGVNNVTIEEMIFTGADDYFLSQHGHTGGQAGSCSRTSALDDGSSFPTRAAIYVVNTKNFNLYYCIFDNLGCEAITMRGRMDRVTVDSCRFFDIGATAIRMADGTANYSATAGQADTLIYGNYIDNTGWSIRQCCATQFGAAYNFDMSQNTILHSSYTAISIGWRWSVVSWAYGNGMHLENVVISNNYIASFMTDGKDGGAIYTLGGNVEDAYTEYFNFLHHNYIVFTKDTGARGMVCGIYHDGSSSNWHDYKNIVVAASSVNERDPNSYYHYIYIQHIDSQETHNILEEDNIALNLRKTNSADQRKEVYRNYLDKAGANVPANERNIMETGTLYMHAFDYYTEDHPLNAIIESAGSEFCMPDVNDILGDDY